MKATLKEYAKGSLKWVGIFIIVTAAGYFFGVGVGHGFTGSRHVTFLNIQAQDVGDE